MQLNQCGRYFEGHIQIQETLGGVSNTNYRRFKVHGLHTSGSQFAPGTAFGQMAIRMQGTDEAGQPLTRFSIGNAARTDVGSSTMFFLSPIDGGDPLLFKRISPKPTVSDTVLSALGSLSGAAAVSQNSPPVLLGTIPRVSWMSSGVVPGLDSSPHEIGKKAAKPSRTRPEMRFLVVS